MTEQTKRETADSREKEAADGTRQEPAGGARDEAARAACRIAVHSRRQIEALEPPTGPYCVISITDSPRDRADLGWLRGAAGVLRLAFPEDGFTPGHARGIWEFVKEQDGRALPGGGQTYLVHCVAGRVRSASVACGLAHFRGGGTEEVERIFEERDPRDDIYDTLCRAYAAVFPPACEAAL